MWLCKPEGDPSHSPQELQVALLQVGVSGQVLDKVKCKLRYSKGTFFSPSPELKRWCANRQEKGTS